MKIPIPLLLNFLMPRFDDIHYGSELSRRNIRMIMTQEASPVFGNPYLRSVFRRKALCNMDMDWFHRIVFV